MPLDRFADPQQTAGEPLRLPPWEQRERYGLLNSLYLTTREVLFAPGRFFDRMPTHLGLVQPLLYGIALTVVASFFDFLWSLAGGGVQQLFARGDLGGFVRAPVVFGIFWVLSPLVAIVQIVMWSLLFHLGLMLVGRRRLSFEATLRVVAYAHAASILSLLPFCGGGVGLIWALTVTILGLAHVHGVETWRPGVVVVLPAALLLVTSGAVLALIVGFKGSTLILLNWGYLLLR